MNGCQGHKGGDALLRWGGAMAAGSGAYALHSLAKLGKALTRTSSTDLKSNSVTISSKETLKRINHPVNLCLFINHVFSERLNCY
jgi:hypothetical protein